MTPNMYDIKLWKTSGHWQHYQDDMFAVVDPKNDKCCCGSGSSPAEATQNGEKPERYNYALKPMNCPGHCIMFKSRVRSWRELPIRFADFGMCSVVAVFLLHDSGMYTVMSVFSRVAEAG
jgi:threonyl-tRNA synthetase